MKTYTKYTILRRNSKESSKFCGKIIQLIAIFSDCILLSVYCERTKVLRKLSWRCNEVLLLLAYLLYVRLDEAACFHIVSAYGPYRRYHGYFEFYYIVPNSYLLSILYPVPASPWPAARPLDGEKLPGERADAKDRVQKRGPGTTAS